LASNYCRSQFSPSRSNTSAPIDLTVLGLLSFSMAFYPKFIIFVHVMASAQTSQAETWIQMEMWTEKVTGNVTCGGEGAFVSETHYFPEDRCYLDRGLYTKHSCNKTHQTDYTYNATDGICSSKPIETTAFKLCGAKGQVKQGVFNTNILKFTCGIANPMVRINEYTDAGCTKLKQERFEPLGVCLKDEGGTSRMATCKNGKFQVIFYKRPDCTSEWPWYYAYVADGMIGSKCHTDTLGHKHYKMLGGCSGTKVSVSKSNMALSHPLLLFAALASTIKFVL